MSAIDKLLGEQLRAIPLLAGLDDIDLQHLLSIFRPVSFLAGAQLVRQAQSANGAYFIERGDLEGQDCRSGISVQR